MFLDEHLAAEKGREHRTIADYRQLHDRWFAPELGLRPVRDIDEAHIDRAFGKMRAAGLSRSRLNHAKSLYRPFFRWAKSRRIIPRNPMLEFQLPTSTYVSKERTPPEVEELSMLLAKAVALTPEIAPVLVLGAVTGMRRGELVGLQRSRIRWAEQRIVVNAAMDGKRVKATKTRMERSFFVDEATIAMLRRHCEHIDDLAAEVGAILAPDPFVFTLSIDGSEPMPAHYLTKRVAVLKEHLGIEEKKPETIAREDEALRMFRQPPAPRQPGVAGPTSKGGMPLRQIGAQLGRSERWAALAVASAERREAAGRRGLLLDFDGSILALRKFTSSDSSTPASTSAWSRSVRGTVPKCSSTTTPSRAAPRTARPQTISVASSTSRHRRSPALGTLQARDPDVDRCRPPAAWDHRELSFASSMGPPRRQ